MIEWIRKCRREKNVCQFSITYSFKFAFHHLLCSESNMGFGTFNISRARLFVLRVNILNRIVCFNGFCRFKLFGFGEIFRANYCNHFFHFFSFIHSSFDCVCACLWIFPSSFIVSFWKYVRRIIPINIFIIYMLNIQCKNIKRAIYSIWIQTNTSSNMTVINKFIKGKKRRCQCQYQQCITIRKTSEMITQI